MGFSLLKVDGFARAIIIIYLNIEYPITDFETNTNQLKKKSVSALYMFLKGQLYYHIHVIEHQLCLLNFGQISTSYLKLNVSGRSK